MPFAPGSILYPSFRMSFLESGERRPSEVWHLVGSLEHRCLLGPGACARLFHGVERPSGPTGLTGFETKTEMLLVIRMLLVAMPGAPSSF